MGSGRSHNKIQEDSKGNDIKRRTSLEEVNQEVAKRTLIKCYFN